MKAVVTTLQEPPTPSFWPPPPAPIHLLPVPVPAGGEDAREDEDTGGHNGFVAPLRLCRRRFGRGGNCACCSFGSWPGEAGLAAAATFSSTRASSASRSRPSRELGPQGLGAPFVDTHCHLEEVLQTVRRHATVPTLNKALSEFTPEELDHWRTLGWLKDQQPEELEWGYESNTWTKKWAELLPAQQEAASFLGYDSDSWDRNQWLLPRSTSWDDLSEDVREQLRTLGETAVSWNHWQSGSLSSSATSEVNSNDMRLWSSLSEEERLAAAALGFTEVTWNSEESDDVHTTIDNLFGTGFEGCVTQACDTESMEGAVRLALAHPKVFLSVGCHPKAAWCYDSTLEARLLQVFKECGRKAVAWGEFGLDYSHPYFGPDASNRRKQKEVFARQLQLAIEQKVPLVIHTRCADRDCFRMMERWVPRNWLVHVHSFRGSPHFMEALLAGWRCLYIGVPGLVTLTDPFAREICRRCPLERMVLETDAPYLPVQGVYFNHPGLIPRIAASVADIKGCTTETVLNVTRQNSRAIYGF